MIYNTTKGGKLVDKLILISLILLYTINSKLYIMNFNKLLDVKYKPTTYNILFLLLSAIVTLKQLFKLVFHNDIMLYITSALMLLVICCIILFAYRNSWRKKLTTLGLFFTATVFTDILSNIICSLFLNIKVEQMTSLTFENVQVSSLNTCLTLVLYLLILRIVPKTTDSNIYKHNELIILSSISLIIFIPSIIILNNIETVKSNLKFVILIEFGIILLLIIYSSLKILTKNIVISKVESKSNVLEKEIRHYHDIAEVTEQLHQLRHDMKNHFFSVRSLIKQCEYDKVVNYIDQICEQIASTEDICLLDDKFLSILLSEKFAQARQEGIDLSHILITDSYFYELMKEFQEIDKTALFTNLLDNAIRAAKQAEKKLIDFSIQSFDNHIEIMCINSKTKEQLRLNKNGTYKSTKGLGHGLGMSIIQETVWKYGGEINYDVSEKIFITTIDFYCRKE